MGQHDYVLDNQSGLNFRADLNNALAAIVSQNSGTTEPATMFAYQWWADTTTGLLKIRNAANSGWVTVGLLASYGLGLRAPYSSASDPASIAYAYFMWVDTSGSPKILKIRNAANSAWTTIGPIETTNFGLLPLTGGTMSGPVSFSNTDYTKIPVGTTAQRPVSPAVGMIRFNTDLVVFETYTGVAWVASGGLVDLTSAVSGVLPLANGGTGGNDVQAKTANYTALVTDALIKCDASGGGFTISLPAASTMTGKRLTILRTDSTIANAVIVDAYSTELIETTQTKKMWGKHERMTITSDGTQWWIQSWQGFRSEIFISDATGYGSTNTRIRYFPTANEIVSRDGDITHTANSTDGSSFTINTTGVYHVWWYDRKSVTGNYQGMSLNSTHLTTSILSIPDSEVLGYGFTPTGAGSTEWTGQLTAGDVIRPHDNDDGNNSTVEKFKIQRVG